MVNQIAFTLAEDENGTLRSGESVEDAIAALKAVPGILDGEGTSFINTNSTVQLTSSAPLYAIPKFTSFTLCRIDGGQLDALLINCSSLESITFALPRIRAALDGYGASSVKIGAYGNGFKTAKSDGKGSDYDEDLTPAAYAKVAFEEWVGKSGASIVGGCCGIFPEHIEKLNEQAKAP